MSRNYIRVIVLLFLVNHLNGQEVPKKREFRASWIATVKNIDWPSRPGLSSSDQKAEIRKIFDFHQMSGVNAVIVQIRPSGDAFYYSEMEPWSQWLTDKDGKPPYPYYDPLEYMIEEAHDRNMEFHAWFNPYRAVIDADSVELDSMHLTQRNPDWFLRYGKNLYFNPGVPAVREYVTEIIKDVVRRYDVDAIHFDDYFYPYKINGVAFPDSLSFIRYGKENFEEKDDWRRNNVDKIIKMLSDSIKAVKPYVKFGISPFGVWRNKDQDERGSATKAGQTNYDDLYADVLKWMQNGWLDYLVPQVYWHIGFDLANYKVLVDWWSQHSYGKHIYIGHGAYRIDSASIIPEWRNPSQIPNQLRLNSDKKEIHGSAYFSAKSIMKNPLGITDSLRNNFYRSPALIPEMPWLDSLAPGPPFSVSPKVERNGLFLEWDYKNSDDPISYFIVYRFKGKRTKSLEDPSNILTIVRYPQSFLVDRTVRKRKRYVYVISAVDRLHNESEPSEPIYIKIK